MNDIRECLKRQRKPIQEARYSSYEEMEKAILQETRETLQRTAIFSSHISPSGKTVDKQIRDMSKMLKKGDIVQLSTQREKVYASILSLLDDIEKLHKAYSPDSDMAKAFAALQKTKK